MTNIWRNDDIQSTEGFGNQVLYDMCSKAPYHRDDGIVGSKCWLIGRAYAASPQRRKIKDKEKEANEYEYFFDRLGYEIINNEKSYILDEGIKVLATASYTGNYERDLPLLIKSLKMVSLMNQVIRESMIKIDGNEITEANNAISFSSKYMHFHIPNIIYIYDNYSRKNANAAYKELSLDNQKRNALAKDLRKSVPDAHISEYRRHVTNCHSLSVEISKDNLLSPRNLDTFLLKRRWK